MNRSKETNQQTGILRVLLVCAVTSFLSACATSKKPGSSFGAEAGAIEGLNVLAIPVGLNLDRIPGPDSFSVKVYAVNATNPKAVPIRSGTLEILTFDGTFFGRTNVPPVLRSWSFESSQLEPVRFQSQVGTGYEFTLSWGTNKPTHTLMSVAARYTSPAGEIVTSRPSSVTVIDK